MIKCPSSTNETATKPTQDLSEYILPKIEKVEDVAINTAAW